MAITSLRPSAASKLVRAFIEARTPILLVGAPGVGKSSIVEQAAESSGFDIIISHPVVSDPTDFKGLPWPEKEGKSASKATFLPFGDFAQALNAKKPTVWFLDDLGQASPAVQAAAMQLLLARRVNGHKLPDHVTFCAATNARQHRAGVQGILTPVISRFGAVIGVEPTVDDWAEWAISNGLAPELIAFIRHRPNLLNASIGEGRKADDMENFPCPRTWEFVGKILRMNLDREIEFAAISGAVGEGAAIEFHGFMEIIRSNMPSIDDIIRDPEGTNIPDRPDVLYALASGIAARASVENIEALGRYLERMFVAGYGEFSVMSVVDIQRRNKGVTDTPAWTQIMMGPIGKSFIE